MTSPVQPPLQVMMAISLPGSQSIPLNAPFLRVFNILPVVFGFIYHVDHGICNIYQLNIYSTQRTRPLLILWPAPKGQLNVRLVSHGPQSAFAHRSFVPRGFNVFTLTEVGLLFEFRFLTGNTCHIEKVCFERDHYFKFILSIDLDPRSSEIIFKF